MTPSHGYQGLVDRLSHRGLFHIEPGLQRISKVLSTLGNPQDRIRTIHIAGTNGKGSVAASLESILRTAGYRTGLYTSPHLHDVRERFQINRSPIEKSDFLDVGHDVLAAEKSTRTPLTYFEILTAIAYRWLSLSGVDVAVIETGLGGRWDATNLVARPELSVITSIGLDHMQWLGQTVEDIAAQKAGIIKAHCPTVSGVRGTPGDVIGRIAKRQRSRIVKIGRDFSATPIGVNWSQGTQALRYRSDGSFSGRYEIGLLGAHQVQNAAVTLAAVEVLQTQGWTVSADSVKRGLRHVVWPARLEAIRDSDGSLIVLDGAHNPPAMKVLATTLADSAWQGKEKGIGIVFSAYKDKDVRAMARILRRIASKVYLAPMPGDRSLSIEALKAEFSGTKVHTSPTLTQALDSAKRDGHDLIVVTGSLAGVGELRHHYLLTNRNSSHDTRAFNARN